MLKALKLLSFLYFGHYVTNSRFKHALVETVVNNPVNVVGFSKLNTVPAPIKDPLE